MPTRTLSEARRAAYGRYPAMVSADQLARCFHLDRGDLAVIAGLRGAHNRIGFAAQLGTVRFLGVLPNDADFVPRVVIATLARQLDEPTPCLASYWQGRQRWRHAGLIRARYGYRDLEEAGAARLRLTRWLYALCWTGDDRPSLLTERAVVWLLAEKVLLPGLSTVERLCARVRSRVHERRWQTLADSFAPEQRVRLDALFDSEAATTNLEGLRRSPQRFGPGELMRHLERLDAIRELALAPDAAPAVPEAVVDRLARAARRMRPTVLARLPEPRRTATLAALFHALEGIALDDALDLFDQLIEQSVKDATRAHTAARLRSLRDLDAAALIAAKAAGLAVAEPGTEVDLVAARERLLDQISAADIRAAIESIERLARPPDDRPFEELCGSWLRISRLFANLLARVEFEAVPAAEPVREALAFLAGCTGWARMATKGAPTACVAAAWRRHVFAKAAKGADAPIADNRAYVFAVLEAARRAMKRRDLFVSRSTRFANPVQGLLEGSAWEASRPAVLRALGRSEDVSAEIGSLSACLDAGYRRTLANLPTNADLRLVEDEPTLAQLDRLEEPASLLSLRAAIAARLPKGDLPDVVLETMARTGFAAAFTHVQGGPARVEGFEISLAAALIAEACNVGLEPMVRPDVPALRRERLSWVSQNFIRDDTLRAAGAVLVAAHDALPIAQAWGSGEVASADGVRFVVRGEPVHAGFNPKYFGHRRGITWYNLVSDQSTGLGGIAVPGTLRDSLVLLGLLLEQETPLEPQEIMTDTAAYSDVVFGLFWLLGYRFSPRLADIGGARLWRVDRTADYGAFDAASQSRIDTDRIIAAWPDLLRLAGSLKLGRVKADGMMRLLQVKERPTALARALVELGRIIKSVHVLEYLDDADKRRRILIQLNRQELRHRLARRVCHGNRGELGAGYREGQEDTLGALDLVLNVIALWNATYMQAVVERLEAERHPVDPADLARVSPLAHRHINLLGRYAFTVPEAVANGELRPLRNPTSE